MDRERKREIYFWTYLRFGLYIPSSPRFTSMTLNNIHGQYHTPPCGFIPSHENTSISFVVNANALTCPCLDRGSLCFPMRTERSRDESANARMGIILLFCFHSFFLISFFFFFFIYPGLFTPFPLLFAGNPYLKWHRTEGKEEHVNTFMHMYCI